MASSCSTNESRQRALTESFFSKVVVFNLLFFLQMYKDELDARV
jgi:hypothetical protein